MRRQLSLVSVLLATAALALAAPASDPPPPRGPLTVFVQPRPDEAEPSQEQKAARKAKSEEASKAYDQVFNNLKKQFGKDRAKWPEDKRTEYYNALDASGVAWSEHYYYARPAKEKADSVTDLTKSLGKSRKEAYVVLAERREDADLLVEILGRKGQAKFVVGAKYLGFDILPGKLPVERLLKLPRQAFKPWFDDRLLTLHWPKPGELYLRFEVSDQERWQDVAAFVGRTADELAKAYYDTLKPAP